MTEALPPPPRASFASDNAAGVAPEVMEALVAANAGPALAYGQDPWSAAAEDALRDLVGVPDAEVLMCWGGTGANVVGLALAVQPWQAVLCVDSAHIVVDECGAPARFTGATIVPVPHVAGKLVPEALAPFLHWQGVEHHPQPGAVSISQATEMGTVYTVDEVAALAEVAHAHDMVLHVDGARIANALVASGTDLRTMVRDTGVDVLTFGLTKDGAMYGEAVLVLRPELARAARYVRKQAGQLPSKARFVAAQVTALLEGDRWLAHARRANALAVRLAERVGAVPGVEVVRPPEVNSVFATLPAAAIAPLQGWSFFWPWDPERSEVRWMTGFATTEDDVDRFAAGVEAVVAPLVGP
ncbi:aminotransferase class V-fold PLP-dependent enzyme [Iamia majanohamensis]|uniref:Aminotransferase class V-fold PLP-dependent enzyme n=1 Tax=Iamia majanohamensis TaxID=467976 RepID=A0AAE9YCH6_9ACTN|nr:aminotransferase class V-fold PLP-dependent enzyme [Iamia majanohamensis]WCO68688.1 aminotransferase class V-fold PLP-dependent enzyme [Iamia majanohamensis]